MEQLKKIGKLKAKKSSEIKYSKIGLGFEKLVDIMDGSIYEIPKK